MKVPAALARIAHEKGALFHTDVETSTWDEESARWVIRTDRGDEIRARFVAMGTGPLHRPKLPGIPGIDTFEGHSFHTSRWDYAYTGGDSDGNLTGLADKRVGIIGTGATAVQCIPPLGRDAKELYVFQRTPSSIDVRDDWPTDPEWAARRPPDWQAKRRAKSRMSCSEASLPMARRRGTEASSSASGTDRM